MQLLLTLQTADLDSSLLHCVTLGRWLTLSGLCFPSRNLKGLGQLCCEVPFKSPDYSLRLQSELYRVFSQDKDSVKELGGTEVTTVGCSCLPSSPQEGGQHSLPS